MPDSNRRLTLGAWDARARYAASIGSPVPTKTVSPSLISRAAAYTMISSVVAFTVAIPGPSGGGGSRNEDPTAGRGGAAPRVERGTRGGLLASPRPGTSRTAPGHDWPPRTPG